MKNRRGVCLWLLLLQGPWWFWGCCSGKNTKQDFNQTVLGQTDIVMLECMGESVDRISIAKANTSKDLVVLVSTKDGDKCEVKETFSSCTFDGNKYTARVLLPELEGTTEYVCHISRMHVSARPSQISIKVTGPVRSTTASLPTVSTGEEFPPKESTNVANASTGEGDGQFLSAVTYAMIAALVILVLICCVLGFKFFLRRWRDRTSVVDPDTISYRSGVTDKSFYFATQGTLGTATMAGRGRGGGGGAGMAMGMGTGMGMDTGMLPGQFGTISSHPAPRSPAPETPGGQGLVMEYQRPFNALPVNSHTLGRKDVRRISEGLVQYQEPWGSMPPPPRPGAQGPSSTSTLQRYPHHQLVKIPDFDTTVVPACTPARASSSSSVPSSPNAPAAGATPLLTSVTPPTQETGVASLEDNVV